jgi:hypothetical protein
VKFDKTRFIYILRKGGGEWEKRRGGEKKKGRRGEDGKRRI